MQINKHDTSQYTFKKKENPMIIQIDAGKTLDNIQPSFNLKILSNLYERI